MPLKFKLRITRLRAPDARELVRRAGDAARDAMQRALLEGTNPLTGRPRERKADGKPVGLNTGTLARGLRRTEVSGGPARARTTIEPPPSRATWVAERGDIIVAEGTVSEAITRAVDEYLEED